MANSKFISSHYFKEKESVSVTSGLITNVNMILYISITFFDCHKIEHYILIKLAKASFLYFIFVTYKPCSEQHLGWFLPFIMEIYKTQARCTHQPCTHWFLHFKGAQEKGPKTMEARKNRAHCFWKSGGKGHIFFSLNVDPHDFFGICVWCLDVWPRNLDVP